MSPTRLRPPSRKRRRQRTGGRSASRPALAGLYLGFLAVAACFFLPWFSLDPDALSPFEDLMGALGLLPDLNAKLRGFEIPDFLERDMRHPVIQGVRALSDLGSGRVDRFGARLLLGERDERDYGGLVLVPLALAAAGLAMTRFPRARAAALAISVPVFAGFGLAVWWWWRVAGPGASPPLIVHEGYQGTAAGLLITGASLLLLRRPRRRR